MSIERDYARDYQDIPARQQLEHRAVQGATVEGAEFNFWYCKWANEGGKWGKGLDKAPYRCRIARDAGRTKADKHARFCINFCRGTCIYGKDCTFLHRIPMDDDEFETTYDVFGRDKHRRNRDDMGGNGSFEIPNRCLYVGGIDINDQMELIIRNHFGEWGEIEHVNVLPAKAVAFVRYKNLGNAEFAKEAMFAQSLEGNEIINVKWAAEDPLPQSVDAVKRKAEDAVIASIAAKLPIVGEKGTILDYENSYKQARFENKDGVSNNSTGYYFGNRETGDEETVTASAAYAFKEPLKTGGLVNGYESSEEDN